MASTVAEATKEVPTVELPDDAWPGVDTAITWTRSPTTIGTEGI